MLIHSPQSTVCFVAHLFTQLRQNFQDKTTAFSNVHILYIKKQRNGLMILAILFGIELEATDMSGSEDERLSQMIRDYIEFDSSSPSSSSKSGLPVDHHSSLASLQEILESVTVAEAEILGKIFLYSRDLEPSKLRKWIVMKLGMDYYEASLCRTSWLTITKFNHPSGDYEYIDVMMKNDNATTGEGDVAGGVRLIVDIDFRSQFELARPTPQYEELSNSLPKIFVGTELKLEKIISLLCPAAKRSLRERGLHIPPWRKASYMHSKWLSKVCKKNSFSELDIT